VLSRAKEDVVMLVELSMVEQRYDAVKEVLEGATVCDTATRYGVDRRTLHRWLLRYANEGLVALADKSSKPDRCPHQMAPEVEARIIELRRSHPGWGPRTILNKLRRELDAPPSRSAIYRCLVRHRLIQPKPRRRRRDDYKRWERSRSMELWQLDIMGNVLLNNGVVVSVITGIDDHSRFCVLAKVVVRATARPVCEALLEALNTHGIPEQILTDNGKVFTGRLGTRPANVLFDRVCLNNGIRHLLREKLLSHRLVQPLDLAWGRRRIGGGGQPLGAVAEPVQWADAKAILNVASSQRRHWISRARGYAKTSDLAAVIASVMLTPGQLRPMSRVYCLAVDQPQGRLVLESLEGYGARTPALRDALQIQSFRVTAPSTGCVLDVLPADSAGAYGLRVDFALVDETCNFPSTRSHRRLLEAFMTALAKDAASAWR
jgi:transposase-like protein